MRIKGGILWTGGNCQEHFLCNYHPLFANYTTALQLQALWAPCRAWKCLSQPPILSIFSALSLVDISSNPCCGTSQPLLAGHSALSFFISIQASLYHQQTNYLEVPLWCCPWLRNPHWLLFCLSLQMSFLFLSFTAHPAPPLLPFAQSISVPSVSLSLCVWNAQLHPILQGLIPPCV